MADNSVKVSNMKLAVTKDVEVKTSAKGTKYLRVNLVTGDGDDRAFFTGMLFGPAAVAAAQVLSKGTKVLVLDGRARQKEYQKKDGTPGVENVININSMKVASKSGVVVIDEFSEPKLATETEAAPF